VQHSEVAADGFERSALLRSDGASATPMRVRRPERRAYQYSQAGTAGLRDGRRKVAVLSWRDLQRELNFTTLMRKITKTFMQQWKNEGFRDLLPQKTGRPIAFRQRNTILIRVGQRTKS